MLCGTVLDIIQFSQKVPSRAWPQNAMDNGSNCVLISAAPLFPISNRRGRVDGLDAYSGKSRYKAALVGKITEKSTQSAH
jgi:hypothetical protein